MPFLRKAVGVSLALASLLCLCYLAAWVLVGSSHFQSWIEASARDAGIELRLGKITLEFPFDLIVSSPEASVPDRFSFSSKEIRANVNPLSLMLGQLDSLNLAEPRIVVRLTASGQEGPASSINLLVRSFVVTNGWAEIQSADGKSITIPRIDLSGHDLNLGSQSGAMETVAFVPELNGEVKISLRASPATITAQAELVQQPGPGTAGTRDAQRIGTGRGELALHFEADSALRLTGHTSLDGLAFASMRYTGNLELSAETDAKRETVTFDLESNTTEASGLGLEDSSHAFPFSTRITGQYTTGNSQLTLPAIRVESPLGTLLGKANLSLDQEPRLTHAVFEIRDVSLSQLQRLVPGPGVPGLADLRAKFSAKLTATGKLAPWSFSGIVETTMSQIAGSDAKIGRLEGRIPFAFRLGHFEVTGLRLDAGNVEWRPPGRKLATAIGSLAVTGDVAYQAGTSARFDGALAVRGGRFATDDGLSAAENIEGKASIELLSRTDGTIRAQLDAKVNAMELLWNRFFGDFKPEGPSLKLSGTYDSKAHTLQIASGRFGLENIGDVAFSGALKSIAHNPAFELRFNGRQLRLSTLYDFFVRETLKTSHPLLGNLRLAGTAGAETLLRGVADNFLVEGTVQLRGVEITSPDHWGVGPVEVTLPFRVEYPKRSETATAKDVPRAALAVRRVTFGKTEIPPFTVFLSVWDNALTLLRRLHIPVYGGALVIERLAWHDIVGSPRQFSFSARIDDISLADLTTQQGWQPFNGSLSGVIPQVTWAEDAFKTDGELALRAFDGEVKLDQLEVTGLGGFLPAVKANVAVREIDLAKATEAFEFGNISGIVEGTVEELVISDGQPSQFRASIETVERKGVSQWISVEALNKITVLSSGAEGNVLYGTLAGLFNSFRYRKLGFKAQLRNDLLILQGIKTEGGKEFLVEGSLIPPTVNIVSHTQRIGFKELLKRLDRIRQTEAGEGPTVR